MHYTLLPPVQIARTPYEATRYCRMRLLNNRGGNPVFHLIVSVDSEGA